MKTTKDIEKEVMGVHNLFWEYYATRDIELRFSLCSEDITFIGSGLHERALNKSEYKKINDEGVKQFPDPFQIEFLWTKLTMLNLDVACVESEVVWSQLINDEIIKELLRNTTILKYDHDRWLVTHVHGSVPDYRLKDGDYMTNEQTVIRNRELERQVFERTQDLKRTLEELELKNRELEIESALEKVRTIAMSMRKPDDMLDVCKAISIQLQLLGVKEIRNVQTAIFYEQRGTYMNYEYYAKHNKTFITETVFTDSEIHNEFAKKMIKGKDEVYTIHVNGSEVKDWIAYQKTTNVFIDKYLETASSLNYYWFSLGPVALGISTYHPLTEEEINLFKRFLKVFELAYQRYLDIEKAEAQAREAQIEASLERVRAVAMSMQKPDDLLGICEVSFNELKKLGFDNIRNALIHIQYDNQKYFMDYDFSDLTGGAITKIEYGSHPVVEDYLRQIRSAKDAFYQGVIKEDQLEEWKDFRRNSGQIDDPRLDKATALYYYFFSIGIGDIGISTLKHIDESQTKILKRFRNVFDLAYRRYTDITQAEAQAREAQIEASLERVRAHAMGLRSSNELSNIIAIIFEELKKLGLSLYECGICIRKGNTKDFTYWGSDSEEVPLPLSYHFPFFDHPILNNVLLALEMNLTYREFIVAGKELQEYGNLLFTLTDFNNAPKEYKESFLSLEKVFVGHAYMQNGFVEAVGNEPIPVEIADVLKRFTNVIDLTYTRFLDLQKAETQAREANIEAALEKVRGRAMAMRSSEDLSATVNVFFNELKNLGFLPRRCGVAIIDEVRRSAYNMITTANNIGDSFEINGNVNLDTHFVLTNMLLNWKAQKEYFLELDAAQMQEYYRILRPQVAVTNFNDARQYGYYLAFKEGMFYVWMDKALQTDELQIFTRFTQVIGLTYRRHLDLQKAEEQAREAQIEAALERVRSRTMGMQRSDELKEVIQLIYEQLVQLNIQTEHTGFIMDYKTRDDYNGWIADRFGTPSQVTIPYFDCIYYNRFNEAKEKGLDFFALTLSFEQKNKFYDSLFQRIPGFPEESKKIIFDAPAFAISTVLLENVALYIENFAGISYSEEENNTLIRFGKVFQQTYTRFLDLQKAEEQAREAKIETSLERVRSKAMAMHSPNDLSDTVNVFFKELKTLGIIPIRCGVGQIDEATRTTSLTTTTSSQQGESFQVIGKVKQTGHPVLDRIFDHWKLQKEYHPVLEGEDIKDYYNVMNTQIGYPEYPEGVTQYGNNFFFKEGFVFAWTENLLTEEELIIFRRFTSVLSLTYRRYMDLKEAEAQAKEAKIEASLERVRSRTMGMQRSDELAETVSVLFKQLLDLGVKLTQLRTCGIVTFKDNEPKGEVWITDITGEIIDKAFIAPYDEAPAYRMIYSKWKQGENFLEINLKGNDFLEHLTYVKKYSAVPNINLEEIQKSYSEIFFHVLFFSEGYLFIISYEPLPEYHDIFKRFGVLFQQTYTRFLDFKKVEAQNKIIQAENERKTKELEDARQLQLSMLPKELPQLPHLDIAVYMKTATEVGGDYYDFNVDDDGTLTVLVGDATGHGMMSGMMVSIMKSFFISNKNNIELKQFFENANNSIKDMHLGRLMMASMGVQITSEKIIATNAGMPSLLYFRNKSKKAGEFVSNNLPLGGMKGIKYFLKEIKYEKGDTLLLMSDGLAELKNEINEQYGYTRVKEEFMSVAQKSPNEIVEHLKDSASQWIKEIEPDDDVTFVIIKVK